MTREPGMQEPFLPTEIIAGRSLESVTISGLASYGEEQSVNIRPLTILAGANSSGKSSSIRSLLLLKQTLDSTIDPGPLMINGPNVRYKNLDQVFTRTSNDDRIDWMNIGLKMTTGKLGLSFLRNSQSDVSLEKTTYEHDIWRRRSVDKLTISRNMSSEDIENQVPDIVRRYAETRSIDLARELREHLGEEDFLDVVDGNFGLQFGYEGGMGIIEDGVVNPHWFDMRERCFLSANFVSYGVYHCYVGPSSYPSKRFVEALQGIIHIPALRRRVDRGYPPSEINGGFIGTFEDYTALVIAEWEKEDDDRLARLINTLQDLELTSAVSTKRRTDNQVEIYVGRPRQTGCVPKDEMVGLADVGVGVSYVLPVLVAMEVANPGQIVYVEQPESHLHPKAAYGLAKAMARAARRGIRVIAETHSALLLLHIQTMVARGELSPAAVGLHWFSLDDDGFTRVAFVEPDEQGRVGDWPEDFADLEFYANSEFIRAGRSS